MKHLRTAPYHPQTNGMTERFNGTLCNALSKMATHWQEDWDTFIPAVLYSYRIKRHPDMKHSPYEMLFGQPPKLVNGETVGPEPETEEQKATNVKEMREKATRPPVTKKSKFAPGQQVLWKAGIRRNKLEPRLEGPFTITQCGPNNTYLLADQYNEEHPVLISGDRLQLYKKRVSDVGRRAVVPVTQGSTSSDTPG
jgi:transposase InsO family protein